MTKNMSTPTNPVILLASEMKQDHGANGDSVQPVNIIPRTHGG
jgi:hypothetical protein